MEFQGIDNQPNTFAKNTREYWVEEAKRLGVELLPEDDKMAEIKAKVLAKYAELDAIEKAKTMIAIKLPAGVRYKGTRLTEEIEIRISEEELPLYEHVAIIAE